MVVIGGSLLFGGGYTSIQGVRVPLALLLAPWGIVVETDGMPTLVWWIIPLVTNLIQIFARRFVGLLPLWRPSVVFDTATTAVFIGYGLMVTALPHMGNALSFQVIALWGIIGTLIGFAITINAERFFLAGCLLVITAITRRH
jgi:hypothetical protein